MSKLTDMASEFAAKAMDTASNLAKEAAGAVKGFAEGAVKTAKEVTEDLNEKRVVNQAEKERAAAKNTALLALADVSKDLQTYNDSLTNSDYVKKATEEIIKELETLKDVIAKMTPETLIPIIEEQKCKWLDEKNVVVEGENYAQMELDKSEIIKRRKMAAKKCDKAIDALKKRAEEEA